ncbi:carboxylesterase 5A-like isoform X2 [Asterias rubens]|uniref:carboxylesterase 5A-like isoform X2 n=1 Tax=Asterias rubens TaxID=7604 RepID=UPI001455A3E6|nr:carboxylesterase 5A-like isoform X2 [Asterias rubens]
MLSLEMAVLASLACMSLMVIPIACVVDPIVSTTSGVLRGVLAQDLSGTDYWCFKGIPYAEPPTGELRFSAPVEKAAWDGTFNATKYGPSCWQDITGVATFYPDYVVQIPTEAAVLDEDCLSLNVYTPVDVNSNASGPGLAVIFYIHGGSYLTGQGSGYDGSALAVRGNVVVVTINYRLNFFGFWGTGDENAKGNYGLLDQQLALKWVNENIAAFGGDPSRVTLFGQSAGGDAVTLHLFANASRPLFRRVATHSGPIASTSMLKPTSEIEDLTTRIGKATGCNYKDTSRLLECLRDAGNTPEALFAHGAAVADSISPLPVVYGPFIDDVFLSYDFDRPDLFHDLLVLHTSGDGSVILDSGTVPEFNPMDGISQEQFDHVLRLFGLGELINLAVTRGYTDQDQDGISRMQSLTDVMLDYNYLASLSRLLKGLPPLGLCYAAIFDHRSDADDRYPQLNLVPHGEELSYVFGLPFSMASSFTNDERWLSHRVMTYWSNFAKSGDPNVNPDDPPSVNLTYWPKYGDAEKYLLIQLADDTPGEAYRQDKVMFWTDYLPNLRRAAVESCPDQLDGSATPVCEEVFIGEGLGFKLTPDQAESLIEVFLFVIVALLALIIIVFGAVLGYKFKYKENKTHSKSNGLVKTNGSLQKNSAFEVNEAFYSESEDTKM